MIVDFNTSVRKGTVFSSQGLDNFTTHAYLFKATHKKGRILLAEFLKALQEGRGGGTVGLRGLTQMLIIEIILIVYNQALSYW